MHCIIGFGVHIHQVVGPMEAAQSWWLLMEVGGMSANPLHISIRISFVGVT